MCFCRTEHGFSFKNRYDCPHLWRATKIKPPLPCNSCPRPPLNVGAMLAECALDVWKRIKSRLRRKKTRLPFFSKSRIHRIHRIYRIYRIATRGKPAISDGGLAAIEAIGDSTVSFRSYYLPEVCPYLHKNQLYSHACFGVLCLPLTFLCKN